MEPSKWSAIDIMLQPERLVTLSSSALLRYLLSTPEMCHGAINNKNGTNRTAALMVLMLRRRSREITNKIKNSQTENNTNLSFLILGCFHWWNLYGSPFFQQSRTTFTFIRADRLLRLNVVVKCKNLHTGAQEQSSWLRHTRGKCAASNTQASGVWWHPPRISTSATVTFIIHTE